MTSLRQVAVTLVGACCVTGFSVAEAAAPTVTQIVPAAPAIGGPYQIAVLSDGFTVDEKWKFDAVADWLFNVKLFNDSFYQAHKASFTVTTVFRPATQSGDAQYGISAAGDISNCYIATTGDVDGNVYDATATLTPPLAPIRTVIIANDVYTNGCTRNLWTYVWAGIQGTSGVLEHELGHLIAGLFDEFSLVAAPFPVGGINGQGEPNGPNCSTFDPPSWSTLSVPTGTPKPGRVEGCDYYSSRIWRPYSSCRMNRLGDKFCFVCDYETSQALLELPTTAPAAPTNLRVKLAAFVPQPQPPPPPERAVRLLVEIHSQSPNVKVLKATEVPGPAVVRQRLIGTHAYEIRDGSNVTTGVLAGNPFESRAFDGRGAGHPAPSVSESATVVIDVPHTTIQNLLARGVEVTFYKLDATPTRENITPARLNALKQQNLAHSIATLTPNDISKFIQELNPARR